MGNGEGREERWMDLAVTSMPAIPSDSIQFRSSTADCSARPMRCICGYNSGSFSWDRVTGDKDTKNYCSLIIIAVLGCVRRTSGNSADSGVTKEIREGKMHHDDFELLHG